MLYCSNVDGVAATILLRFDWNFLWWLNRLSSRWNKHYLLDHIVRRLTKRPYPLFCYWALLSRHGSPHMNEWWVKMMSLQHWLIWKDTFWVSYQYWLNLVNDWEYLTGEHNFRGSVSGVIRIRSIELGITPNNFDLWPTNVMAAAQVIIADICDESRHPIYSWRRLLTCTAVHDICYSASSIHVQSVCHVPVQPLMYQEGETPHCLWK